MDQHFQTHRPELMGTSWMVTADHPLAARAGAAVLESGGNALDAAVAANLVLTVVRPHMCGIGGDLFALVFMQADGELRGLNASGRAPAAASLEAYAGRGLQSIPETGILSCTVPGAVAGWQELLERFGTRGLDQLLPEAVHYAENGFPMYPDLREAIAQRRPRLEQESGAAGLYCPDGKPPALGELLVQPRMGQACRMLAEQGPDALYRGDLGRALLKYSEKSGGLFNEADLAKYRPEWVDPLKTVYRGYELCTMPPNSQGIALLIQANLLEAVDVQSMAPDQAELIHLMVEGKKLAFADRDRFVCDPDFHPVPVRALLDREAALRLARQIDPNQAASSVSPRSFTQGGEDTVYLAVVDAEGNAVSLIQSLYEPFGSCCLVPETGMFLQNRGRGFSLDPEHPNRLEPGKRPYHTLHPAMVLKKGRPHIVLGSPGADGQTQTVMQLLTAMLDFQAGSQEAMEAPRWRSEPDGTLLLEGRFSEKTAQILESMGHRIKVAGDWDGVMGSSQAIRLDHERGLVCGGADPRRQAYAIGR